MNGNTTYRIQQQSLRVKNDYRLVLKSKQRMSFKLNLATEIQFIQLAKGQLRLT